MAVEEFKFKCIFDLKTSTLLQDSDSFSNFSLSLYLKCLKGNKNINYYLSLCNYIYKILIFFIDIINLIKKKISNVSKKKV